MPTSDPLLRGGRFHCWEWERKQCRLLFDSSLRSLVKWPVEGKWVNTCEKERRATWTFTLLIAPLRKTRIVIEGLSELHQMAGKRRAKTYRPSYHPPHLSRVVSFLDTCRVTVKVITVVWFIGPVACKALAIIGHVINGLDQVRQGGKERDET